MDRVAELTTEVAEIESRSRLEGRQMTMILSPKAATDAAASKPEVEKAPPPKDAPAGEAQAS